MKLSKKIGNAKWKEDWNGLLLVLFFVVKPSVSDFFSIQ